MVSPTATLTEEQRYADELLQFVLDEPEQLEQPAATSMPKQSNDPIPDKIVGGDVMPYLTNSSFASSFSAVNFTS
jgi:hypothetical protein